MKDLIDALVDTKKTKSIEVAKTLKLVSNNDKSYNLVIRKANLNLEDAKNIANAINQIDQNKGPKLHTLSVGFNKNLKDEGVITVLNLIPKTTSVIAFVECGIINKVGQAETNNLNGIYREGNIFSKEIEVKFEKLRTDNLQITVLSEWLKNF